MLMEFLLKASVALCLYCDSFGKAEIVDVIGDCLLV